MSQHRAAHRLWLALSLLIVLASGPALRAEDASKPPAKVELSREERIEQALKGPCRLEAQDVPLPDAADALAQQHNIAVRLDHKALAEAGVAPDAPVTLTKSGTLYGELKHALRPLGATVIVRDETLLITTTAVAETRLETRVYPVRDLLEPSQPDLFGNRADNSSLIETISASVFPSSWQDVGGSGVIEPFPRAGALVILQTWEAHREIEPLLASIRAAKSRQPKAAGTRSEDRTAEFDPVAARPNSLLETTAGIDGNPRRAAMREKIDRALQELGELELVDVSLHDLATVIGEKTGLTVRLDKPSLAEAGIQTDEPAVREVRTHSSLRAALKLAIDGMDLTWLVAEDALLIVTKAFAETELETRTYPVRDLVAGGEGPATKLDFDSLLELVASTVSPQTWEDVGGAGSLQTVVGVDAIVVSQTFAVHREIEQLLAMLRDVRDRQPEAAKPAKSARATGELLLRIYDVDATARGLGGVGGGMFNFDDKQAAAAVTPAQSSKAEESKPGPAAKCDAPSAPAVNPNLALAEQLVKAIPELIEPQSWHSGGGPGRIFPAGTRLLVRQTAEVHAQIEELLTALQQ